MKKFFSLITTFAVILSMLVFPETVKAEGEAYFSVESTSGKKSDTIQVTVSLKNSPGFGGMAFDVVYDNTALKPVSCEMGLGGEAWVYSPFDRYENKINFQYAAISNVEGDGVLATIGFEVLLATETTAEISVSASPLSTFYYGGENGRVEIDFSVASATHTVNITCAHVNTVETPETPSDFENTGYTAGVYCNDCEEYVSGHEIIPAKNISVNALGGVEYSAKGREIAVSSALACKAAYLDDGKYITLNAEKNDDGTYSFTAPEGVLELVLVIAGDVDADGTLSASDRDTLAKSLYPEGHSMYQPLTAEQLLAADLDGSGSIDIVDRFILARAIADQTNEAYKPIEW